MPREATPPQDADAMRRKKKRRVVAPSPSPSLTPAHSEEEDNEVKMLNEEDANQLRVRLAVEMEFWESAGGIPEEFCGDIEGSILLLEGVEREEMWGEFERLKKPPPPPSPPPPPENTNPPSPPLPPPCTTTVQGVPVPCTSIPCSIGGTAGRIDARKMSEISIDKLQRYMNPTQKIRGVSFVCSLDPIPEYSDDEVEEEGDDEVLDGSATARYKMIPPMVKESTSLWLLCADYLEYTPAPWLETVTVDDVAIQCAVLSVNGEAVPIPSNWQDRGEASHIDRYKTFTCAKLPCRDGFLGVQFADGMSPWRACLLGVEIDEISLQEYVEEVAERDVPVERPWEEETGVETTSVTLKCPLTQMRIAVPSRGVSCTHPECFDLSSFITMSSSLHAWSCPICDASLPPAQLIVDVLLQEVLNTTQADVVWISKDGTWEVPEEKKKPDVEVIELD